MAMTPAQVSEARRRKVRKGTHSCWECRRRKIRCQYAAPDDTICIGCRTRGSSCRSQEFPDESPSPQQVPEKKVTQRLDRLEGMMEQLMTHVMAAPEGSALGSHGSHNGSQINNDRARSHHSSSIDASDSGGPSPLGQCPVNAGLITDDEMALERIKRLYRDPTEVVAHVCPTAAGKQGYGELDVLDMSTADDTPVAALLGIQDSLSHGNVLPNPQGNSSSQSPGSADATGSNANSPGNGGNNTNPTTNDNNETAAKSATVEYSDPVTAIWARHLNLSKLLHSLFPAQEDIDTITAGAPAQYVVTLFHSKHDIANGRSEAPEKLREIPPVKSHPTVLGRRLLQIALCMQQMGPCFVLQNKLNMPDNLSEMINRISGVVCHTITSNDELIGSVEGLECLVLLGQQQANAGQLRKAWLTYRRAMSLAQLMGLDRGNTRALKSCDPTSDARTRPTPEMLWYRINECDRYVSLLLGLRAGTQDDEDQKPSDDDNDTDTPVEKLEKAHTLLTGRIIERNHSKMSLEQSYKATQAIDCSLKMAAARHLDASWWEVPTYDPYARPEFTFKEMERSVAQVHHHCILILLHLPYMLRGDNPAATEARTRAASTSPACRNISSPSHSVSTTAATDADAAATANLHLPSDGKSMGCGGGLAYSKAACMQSSRAVLQRFVHFRLVNNTAFSCRHVDYASLIAAMTLIIGYLGPRPAATSDLDVLDNFDNQLRKDRAMVEQVRERMEHIGKTNKDKLSRESAATIQQLLPVLDLVSRKAEEPVVSIGGAPGAPTTPAPANTGTAADASFYSDGAPASTPTQSAVRLNVPYFGTVNIHASNASPGTAQYSQAYQQQQQLPSGLNSMIPGEYSLFSPSIGEAGMNWGMPQGQTGQAGQASQAGARQETQTTQAPDGVDLNAMLVDFDPIPVTDADGSGPGGGVADGGDGFFGLGGAPPFPDLTGSADDWVMQGVDTTYWSLLNSGGKPFGGQMG